MHASSFPVARRPVNAAFAAFLGGTLLIVPIARTQPASQQSPSRPDATVLEQQALEASRQLRRETRPPMKIRRTPAPVFRAGAAEIDITPTKPLYLDGYWKDRLTTGVHDPLYVKALVLDDGRTRIALVIADLIGYYHQWVRQARQSQDAVPPENVIICTTHSHSTPCMLGVFGPPGSVDMGYVRQVGRQMADAIRKAAADLQPARIGFAEIHLPLENGEIPGVARNWHNPGVVDSALLLLRVEHARTHRPIATLINFGNHPDVLGDQTTLISADCFHYVYQQVSKALGGPTLVFNRALGGVEPIGQGANEIAQAETHMKRIGSVVSDHAIKAAGQLEWIDPPRLALRRTTCKFPLLSKEVLKVFARGASPVRVEGGAQVNEMALVEVGPAQFLTVAGEPHPEVVFKLTDIMTARYRFVLAMAEDEIGYVVPAELYNPEGIQELLSTGRDNERVVLSAAARLIGVNAYIEPECLVGKESRLPQ